MNKEKQMENITLRGVQANTEKENYSRIVINEHFGMFYNGGKDRLNFMQEGQVYRVHEGRIVIVTEGSFDTSLDLEDYHLEKGDVILIAPDTIQEMKRSSDDFDMIVFSFSEEVALEENQVLHTNSSQWREILQLTDMLWALAQNKPFRKKTILSLVTTIINNVEETIHANNQDNKEKKISSNEMLLSRFKKLVSKSCDHERTVGFYAEQLYLTPNHLSAVISKTSGKTVMQWINRAVILKAKVLLMTTELKTYEVADRLNFPDHATFSKFFKRETGMTPKEYMMG